MFYSLGALNRNDIDLIYSLEDRNRNEHVSAFRMRPASPPSPDTSAQSTRPDNLLPGWRGLQLYPPPLARAAVWGRPLVRAEIICGWSFMVLKFKLSDGLKWC